MAPLSGWGGRNTASCVYKSLSADWAPVLVDKSCWTGEILNNTYTQYSTFLMVHNVLNRLFVLYHTHEVRAGVLLLQQFRVVTAVEGEQGVQHTLLQGRTTLHLLESTGRNPCNYRLEYIVQVNANINQYVCIRLLYASSSTRGSFSPQQGDFNALALFHHDACLNQPQEYGGPGATFNRHAGALVGRVDRAIAAIKDEQARSLGHVDGLPAFPFDYSTGAPRRR